MTLHSSFSLLRRRLSSSTATSSSTAAAAAAVAVDRVAPMSLRPSFSLLLRRLSSSTATSSSTAAAAAAADDLWKLLLHSDSSSGQHLERVLSTSNAVLTPSLVHSVLRLSSSSGDPSHLPLALRFFVWSALRPRQWKPSAAAYAAVSELLCLHRRPDSLSRVLDSYLADAVPVSLGTFKVLLSLCRHAALPDEAFSLLRRMPEFGCLPDTASYNVVIRLLADLRREDGSIVAALLEEMADAGLSPDVATYVAVVRSLSAAGSIDSARGLVERMRTSGCIPNVVVYSALVDGACNSGHIDTALEVLEEMERGADEGCAPNVVTYTCLIKCLSNKGRLEEALGILDRMGRRGCLPNHVTVRTLVEGFCKGGRVRGAYELVEKVVQEGSVSSSDCYSLLVVCLLKVGNLVRAEEVFRMILEKGIRPSGLAVNALMRELCRRRKFLDVYRLQMEMEAKGLACIDSDVYCQLLSGFCGEGHFLEAAIVAEKIVEREITLPDDCINGIVEALNKFSKQDLASQIMTMKQLLASTS